MPDLYITATIRMSKSERKRDNCSLLAAYKH